MKRIALLVSRVEKNLEQRKKKKKKRDELWSKLIQNDNKCRKLRLQMAKSNLKATAKSQYKINEDKVKQIIFLTLKQIEIKNQLKNEEKWLLTL
tara:strand:+ start:962 stop:1243 length:282 start_codon:yes stop_codon:yes gene_type:complete